MHNKPVKVHIQIKDRIKSQVIKKQVRTKENKIQDIPLIIQGNIAIPPSSNKKQVYLINTPVSLHCSFISGRIHGWFTKYGSPGIVLPRWPQRNKFTTSPEWSYPGWSPGPFHQLCHNCMWRHAPAHLPSRWPLDAIWRHARWRYHTTKRRSSSSGSHL